MSFRKNISEIVKIDNMGVFIFLISFLILIQKFNLWKFRYILQALVPLFFLPYLYRELKLREVEQKKIIFIVSGVGIFLFTILLEIFSLGLPIIKFLPNYINNFLIFAVLYSIIIVSLFKNKNIGKKTLIYNLSIIWGITYIIPIINYFI